MAEHVVRTPGAVEAMDITYFESGVSASCRDLLIVYVNLKDLQGTGCFGENNREVNWKYYKVASCVVRLQ